MPLEKTSVFVLVNATDPLNGWLVLVDPDSALIAVTLLVLVRAASGRPTLVRTTFGAPKLTESSKYQAPINSPFTTLIDLEPPTMASSVTSFDAPNPIAVRKFVTFVLVSHVAPRPTALRALLELVEVHKVLRLVEKPSDARVVAALVVLLNAKGTLAVNSTSLH